MTTDVQPAGLTRAYPREMKLANGKKIELHLMDASAREELLTFARSLPKQDVLFLRMDLPEFGESKTNGARAVELLQRGLTAADHAGHAIYSGLRSLPFPRDLVGQLWRCCDMVREHRGDSHISVWTKALVKPIEIQLMSEMQLGIPLKTYSATRGWTVEQMDAALDSMRAKGWVEGDQFTAEGRAFRDRIESDTDAMETPIVEAIGGDFEMLIGILRPWAAAIVKAGIAGGGYPGDVKAITEMSRASR